MSSDASESDELPVAGWDGSEGLRPTDDRDGASSENPTLREIVEQLGHDSQECWHALEGLASVELEVRLSIIDELSHYRNRPGVLTLLRLLSTARDARTREAASRAIPRADAEACPGHGHDVPARATLVSQETHAPCRTERAGLEQSENGMSAPERTEARLARCLVAPVNGRGRSSIVISVNQKAQRRTAAFLCDVQRGIRDVFGEVEPESPRAGRLLDDVNQQTGADCVGDVPELALGLLAGSLMLCGTAVPAAVRDWLDGTLGREFQPAGFPATVPGLSCSSIPPEEIPERAHALLDACPSWLDASPLTFELAEEIRLREGRPAADPDRDAGAYRFLFEHRLIHRLELYRRMLLWMAWLWKCSGQVELSKSAWALAAQLSDEQYAVPSHPFTVELTTRSLKAAQVRLGTKAWRSHRGGA
ncbi:MAG: hypothetical protein ACHRXM_25805 [Isosphaerales bacterium]